MLFRSAATQIVPLSENGTYRAQLQALNPGTTLVYLPDSSYAQLQGGVQGAPTYQILQGYLIQSLLSAGLPLPSAGGVVGKTKLADDNSPIPRDRVVFSYDQFNSVPLTPNGFDVHRYAPGIEKTFLDGCASVELRLPFASTLSSVGTLDGSTPRDTEFGNVNLTFKGLLLRGDRKSVV